MQQPITLARMGSFVAGGRRIKVGGQPTRKISLSSGFSDFTHDPNGEFWVDQAYVQFFIPADRRINAPILLVHGGGLTGACWETTPDGRAGWLQWLLARGAAIYVIDNVERGRAGFCALPGVWTGQPIQRSAEEAWTLFRMGTRAGFPSRTPFERQQFPVAFFDDLMQRGVPRWLTNGDAQVEALAAAVRRIGRCILVGHSQGGGHVLAAAGKCPDLVEACILLEPHGSPDRFEDLAGCRALLVRGDNLDRDDVWRGITTAQDEAMDRWRGAKGQMDVLDLPTQGIVGNSHMLMMDRNAEEILDLVLDWATGAAGKRAPAEGPTS